MNLKQAIEKSDIEIISKIFKEKYPLYDLGIHIAILEGLRYVKALPSNFRIHIESIEGEEHYIVSGYSEKEKELFAIEFLAWAEWLGMEIHEVTFACFCLEEIVVHCLFEMTVPGYDQEEIKKQYSEIEGFLNDFEKGTPESRPFDLRDFMKEMKEEAEDLEDEDV